MLEGEVLMDEAKRLSSGSMLTRRDLVQLATAAGISVPALIPAMTQEAGAQATPAGATPVATDLQGEPIRIGAAISTTGSNEVPGRYQREAYLLWAALKNAADGLLGRPVEMLIHDDGSDADTSAEIYERLIVEDEVDLVMGPYSSPSTIAAARVTEQYGYPLLAPGSAAPEIWESGFAGVFGIISNAHEFFRDIILTVATEQGYSTAAVIYQDALFPAATARGATAHCEEAGIDVVIEDSYPVDATDVSSLLTSVRDADPDLLIGGSYQPDSVLIMQQAKELDVNPRLFAFSIGVAQPEFHEALGVDAEYVLGPSMWEPDIPTEGNQEFLEAYRAMWGREPAYQAADGYAACQILERAVSDVGELVLDALRDHLFELNMTTILPGEYRVDETGKQVGHIPLSVQWQDGEKVVVTPEDLRTGEVRLPTPPWGDRG